jgi:HPt (histidine-containing phosphotransfer) domain-containing protein
MSRGPPRCPPVALALVRIGAPALAAQDRRLEDSPAQDVSNKADFVGLSPRLLSIGLSP